MTVSEKLASIVSGWKNLLYKDLSIEGVAMKRAEKCAKCNNANNRNFCVLCNCYIPAKIRSLKEQCPIGEW